MIGRCPDHGHVEGERCPLCGEPCERVLGEERRVRLSRFVSGALRHFPGDAGLTLDDAGWTDRSALAAAVGRRYDWADGEALDAVVATDPKGRFERDDDGRIRATYGHSVDVALGGGDDPHDVPSTLYHGTQRDRLDRIRDEGIRPMGRQRVHLSPTIDGAIEVARRHGDDPVAIPVDAAAMIADGADVDGRSSAVYTTDRVPPPYLGDAVGPDRRRP